MLLFESNFMGFFDGKPYQSLFVGKAQTSTNLNPKEEKQEEATVD